MIDHLCGNIYVAMFNCFLQQSGVDVLSLQSMIVAQPFGIDERREPDAIFGDEFLSALGVDFFA